MLVYIPYALLQYFHPALLTELICVQTAMEAMLHPYEKYHNNLNAPLLETVGKDHHMPAHQIQSVSQSPLCKAVQVPVKSSSPDCQLSKSAVVPPVSYSMRFDSIPGIHHFHRWMFSLSFPYPSHRLFAPPPFCQQVHSQAHISDSLLPAKKKWKTTYRSASYTPVRNSP